jgi:hypothetical protein
MIKKVKKVIKKFFDQQNEILRLNKEMEWAHIYHDSIRGKKWLEELPLNIGRWAGNYTFFYILNRILNDFKPQTILEFGLGESTKFVIAYLNNSIKDAKHLVIEHDLNWKDLFINDNSVSSNTEIAIYALEKRLVNGFESNSYSNIENNINTKFDLYIIDGPFGSKNFSRYDIVFLANKFTVNDEFIIVFDDYNRLGEKETITDLQAVFKNKNIKIYSEIYRGNKDVIVLATEKYKYVTSL